MPLEEWSDVDGDILLEGEPRLLAGETKLLVDEHKLELWSKRLRLDLSVLIGFGNGLGGWRRLMAGDVCGDDLAESLV